MGIEDVCEPINVWIEPNRNVDWVYTTLKNAQDALKKGNEAVTCHIVLALIIIFIIKTDMDVY